MVVVANTIINSSRLTADAAAPVAPNVLNDALPVGVILSMGVVANSIINESRADEDATAPVSLNVLNYVLPGGVILSMLFVEKLKLMKQNLMQMLLHQWHPMFSIMCSLMVLFYS